MIVKDLIKALQAVEDKNLEVLLITQPNDEDNPWLNAIEVSNTGDSGYEVGGEVRLISN